MLERGEKEIAKRGERQPEELRSRFLSPLAQMDRLFDEVFKRPFFSLWSPRMAGGEVEDLYMPVDMFEDGESVVLKAEVPGIKKEDIHIELTPDRITISGKKSEEKRTEQKDYFRLERSYGSFTRSFQLPVETITDKARAVFKDGVLEVRIPKNPEAQQRVKKLTIE